MGHLVFRSVPPWQWPFILAFISRTKVVYLSSAPVEEGRGKDNRSHLLRFREFKIQLYFFFFIPKDQPTPDTFSRPFHGILCEHTCQSWGGCPASDYLVHIAEPMCVFFFSTGRFLGTYLGSGKNRQSALPVCSVWCVPVCLLPNFKGWLWVNVCLINVSSAKFNLAYLLLDIISLSLLLIHFYK